MGARLRQAIKQWRSGSIREFQREMRARGAPRSTYPTINGYLKDETEPPPSFFTEAAALLNVRREWLTFGTGQQTEQEEQTQSALEGVTRSDRPKEEWDWREDIKVVQQEFGDGSERLAADPLVRMVVLGTWGRMLLEGLLPRLPPDGFDEKAHLPGIASVLAGSLILPEDPSERRIPYAIGRFLGRALRAPFRNLPLCPEDLSDSEFLDYVTLICQGLGRLADAHRRRGNAHQQNTELGDEAGG